MIDWVSAHVDLGLALLDLGLDAGLGHVDGDQLALRLRQQLGGDRLDILQRGFGPGAGFVGHHSSPALAGDEPVLFQPVAQHLDLDVEPAAVVLQEMRALGREALLEVAEQRLVGLPRPASWLRLQTSANFTVASRSPSR